MKPKYKIGDTIKNTDAFEDVVVKDIFISPTTQQYCYGVWINDGNIITLCFEGELESGAWKVIT